MTSEPADLFVPARAFYKREIESIFMKVWNFLGRVEQVAKPGDYFAATFAGVPNPQ